LISDPLQEFHAFELKDIGNWCQLNHIGQQGLAMITGMRADDTKSHHPRHKKSIVDYTRNQSSTTRDINRRRHKKSIVEDKCLLINAAMAQ